VRVLLTIDGDSKVMNRASRLTANRLLAAGVRVYLHPGMLHTKAASVDGLWAYVGTGNFDALSLRQDRELGLAISGGPVLGRVEDVLRSGHRPEWELTEPLPLEPGDYFASLIAGLFL
jgi:cardiolipin synthase